METAALGTVRTAGITACAPDKSPSGRFLSPAQAPFS